MGVGIYWIKSRNKNKAPNFRTVYKIAVFHKEVMRVNVTQIFLELGVKQAGSAFVCSLCYTVYWPLFPDDTSEYR